MLRYGLVVTMIAVAMCTGVSLAITPERKAQVEADWVKQAGAKAGVRAAKTPTANGSATTTSDAIGGCDGVKTGEWGFHTAVSKDPWWQVDLGACVAVGRVVAWNRCQKGMAERNNRMAILFSQDGKTWEKVYTHDGTRFGGVPDKKPLSVTFANKTTRFVRCQLAGNSYFHLDEVEVFGPDDAKTNLALGRPADQISTSQWSVNHVALTKAKIAAAQKPKPAAPAKAATDLAPRWAQRREALADPLLDFDAILFTKRVPGSYSHMSDQYYGWWSRPGGGIYTLRGFKDDAPVVTCLTDSFKEPGSFLRPELSYDGKKVLFAWCKHYPKLAGERNKLDKANIPEDAFYQVFEMNIDGSGVRQLTKGKYDDFDARYLPDGRIVFLSTRRGQAVQVGLASARHTLAPTVRPDVYVRCGGGASRPVAVFTLHTMNRDGSGLNAISPFEEFEWTPSIAADGTILHARWDYVDRHNNAFMSLWSINTDGTNARIVYGNYTRAPHCIFEAKAVPNSNKLVFTASAPHAQTQGSLVLLDTTVGTEGPAPLTRLTPEVKFPEIEGWSPSQYANPWPLSERLYLTAWGCESSVREGRSRAPNGMGLYLFDAKTQRKELLYRDPDIACQYPIPIRPRRKPPAQPDRVDWAGPAEGRFLVTDVYRGLTGIKRGTVKAIRIIAVPPKTQPTMNSPRIGLTREDPGKCVLGTVPVDADGSAYFRVPSGVIVFFQALDARGMAVQTMRSTTHVQPGQTQGCIGCHESRMDAPPSNKPVAIGREASRIAVGPSGSWPLRFDRLVQPVLDAKCISCHSPKSTDAPARKLDLTPAKAYDALCKYGTTPQNSLVRLVHRDYSSPNGLSKVGGCAAANSALMAKLEAKTNGKPMVTLTAEYRERLIVWMDTYAQYKGSFSDDQELVLVNLRRRWAALLIERKETTVVSVRK